MVFLKLYKLHVVQFTLSLLALSSVEVSKGHIPIFIYRTKN